jgi:3-oxoadipate enol-lactonase
MADSLLPKGRKVLLPGRGTTFVRDMEGPPGAPTVVLLHGLYATTALNWPRAFDALSPHFRVVALDHRGHGGGVRSRRPFRLADCADDVIALADVLGIDRVIPVGYSMGGPVALYAARRHPDRVAGMVLCATAAHFGDGAERDPAAPRTRSPYRVAMGRGMRLVPEPVRRQMAASVLRATAGSTQLPPLFMEEARRHDPAALIEALGAVRRFDARPWAATLRTPAAVVLTARDGMVSPRRQAELAQLTGARVYRVEADHDVAVRSPGIFLPVMVDACRSIASPAVRV